MDQEDNNKQVTRFWAILFFLTLASLSVVSADLSGSLASARKGFFGGDGNLLTGQATSRTTNVSLTVNNAVPIAEAIVIGETVTIASQSVTENTNAGVNVSFTVTDADGTGDITKSSANVTIRRATGDGNNGAGNESTTTDCYAETDVDSDTANFTCTVNIHYWFLAGEWNVTVGITDSTTQYSHNTSNFTLAETTAIVISPLSLTFAGVNIGDENATSNNDPIVVNNTANDNIDSGDVRVAALDLQGEVTATDTINANNFTIDIDTGGSPPAECTAGTEMVNNTATGIASSVLTSGNRSISTIGLEELYVCLRRVPAGISAQAYSTLNGTSWTVSVV